MKHSYSSLQNLDSCQQLYLLENIKKVRSRHRPLYFTIGTAFHEFIGAWHMGLPHEACVKKVDEEFGKIDLSLLNAEQTADFHMDWARVIGMASAYVERYASDRDQYQKFLVEKHAEIELIPDELYHGYIDVLMQDASGAWWIKETKTVAASTLTEAYWQKVKIDNQTLGYAFLAKKILGEWPVGVVYDVIKKTQHRKRAQETVQQFCTRIRNVYAGKEADNLFFRREYLLNRTDLKRWLDDYRQKIARAAEMRRNQHTRWTMNTGHCLKWGNPCGMFAICMGGGEIDPVLYKEKDETGSKKEDAANSKAASDDKQGGGPRDAADAGSKRTASVDGRGRPRKRKSGGRKKVSK